MNWQYFFNGFIFNDHCILDQQIKPISCLNDNPVITDGYQNFAINLQPGFA